MATPFLARLALGEVSKSAIKQWNPAAFTIEPDPRNARVYEKRYATFRKLYPRIRDLMEELGAGSDSEMRSAYRSPSAAKQHVPAAAGQPLRTPRQRMPANSELPST
jgi:hypothetical protein